MHLPIRRGNRGDGPFSNGHARFSSPMSLAIIAQSSPGPATDNQFARANWPVEVSDCPVHEKDTERDPSVPWDASEEARSAFS